MKCNQKKTKRKRRSPDERAEMVREDKVKTPEINDVYSLVPGECIILYKVKAGIKWRFQA